MKLKIIISAFSCMLIILTLNYFLIFNVHITNPFYNIVNTIESDSHFNISSECDWKTNEFDFSDYKPDSFILIAELLGSIDKNHNIKSILRDGSFLHTFRNQKADMDMDIYMIIPYYLKFSESYKMITDTINKNKKYRDLKFEYQNILLSSIFWDKSDAVRISYKGKKILDIDVIHERFINDDNLQYPCFKQMDCKMINDKYIKQNIHYIKTKNLFENLCKCNYMDTELYCFNMNGEKYLEIRYGKNFRTPVAGGNNYDLIYERPKYIWRSIISKIPWITKLKRLFEGHQTEEENHFNSN